MRKITLTEDELAAIIADAIFDSRTGDRRFWSSTENGEESARQLLDARTADLVPDDVIVLDSEGGEAAAHFRNGVRGFTYDYDAVSDTVLRLLGVEIKNGNLFPNNETSYDDIPKTLAEIPLDKED
jgi:hypothetical protein